MTTLRRSRMLLPVLLTAVLLGAACGDDDGQLDTGGPGDGGGGSVAAPPDEPAAITGELTLVSPFEPVTEDCVDPSTADPDGSVSSDDPPFCTDPDRAPLGAVLVESRPGVQEGDKLSLRIEPGTTLLRAAGDGYEALTFDDLRTGDPVDAWVDGPIAESYPGQGTASAVVVRG